MNDRPGRIPALLLAAFLAASPATVPAGDVPAGEAADGIFALGVLDAVGTGETLVYSHRRSGSAAGSETVSAITDGRVEIVLRPTENGGRAAHVALVEGERARRLNPFPGAAGNPLLMVFMETNVRTMAAVTGGSPFYIRNRMREALRGQDAGEPVTIELAGEAIRGQRFTFHPFAGNPNGARMGAFAQLAISFVLSDAVPGRFALLEAVTGVDEAGAPALRETISFERIEEAEP